ncbi:sensor histidine kinase [Lonsdalea quercina]|uniref:sensor histidine kinase n=1 Tax=Lonsdalea quercina TaxID=71657 RepID=UPI003974B883
MKVNYSKKYTSDLKDKIKKLQSNLEAEKRKNEKLLSLIVSTMHEVRLFSSVLSNEAYNLQKIDLPSEEQVKGSAETIFYTSGMLFARLGYTDLEINPAVTQKQAKVSSGFYKKFDKARYLLLKKANEKNIRINFLGTSHMEFDAIPAFDLVPFVLLQNAVKYTPSGYSVDISFEERNNSYLEVRIRNYGPHVSDEEIPFLFEKGKRGNSVSNVEGEGEGLYLAKRICDFHFIKLRVELGDRLRHQINGVNYRLFTIIMDFERL